MSTDPDPESDLFGDDLPAPLALALTRLFTRSKLEELRDTLEPGSYPIDATLRIRGALKVGPPQEYNPAAQIPVYLVLALALRKCGVAKEAFGEVLVEILTEAMARDLPKEKRGEMLALENDLKGALEEAQKLMKKLPKLTRRGAVSARVIVENLPVTS